MQEKGSDDMHVNNRAPACIICLIGLPCAGKTCLARSLVATCAQSGFRLPVVVHHVCFDDFEREALSSLDPSDGAAYAQLYLECSLEISKARNAKRSGREQVPVDALERMHAMMQPPPCCNHNKNVSSAELTGNNFELNTLALAATAHDQADLTAQMVWHWLQKAWGCAAALPPSPMELKCIADEGRATNAASVVHGLDLSTRTLLSATVARCPQGSRGRVAQELNAARQRLLAESRKKKEGEKDCLGAFHCLVQDLQKQFEELCMRVPVSADQ